MLASLAILDRITMALPRIKDALGDEEWFAFMGQLQVHAASFQNLQTEAELQQTINRTLGPFFVNPQIAQLFLQPKPVNPDPRIHARLPSAQLNPSDIPSIANEFYRVCHDPEAIMRTLHESD